MHRQRVSSLTSPSVSRLGGELSAVINRVRSAFGPIPMRGSATRPRFSGPRKSSIKPPVGSCTAKRI